MVPLPSFTFVMQASRNFSLSVAPVAGAIVVRGVWSGGLVCVFWFVLRVDVSISRIAIERKKVGRELGEVGSEAIIHERKKRETRKKGA